MPTLAQFIGKDVNIYGPEGADHDGFIEAGRLLGVEDGFLLLAQGETPGANVAVNLAHVMVVAVREEEVQLRPISGGKVHRLRREGGDGGPEGGEPRGGGHDPKRH